MMTLETVNSCCLALLQKASSVLKHMSFGMVLMKRLKIQKICLNQYWIW
uniref:Uncharacterized protein n=1 Tax=Brassica campestris TaxID=3711 RepID=A0A3P5ZJ48_BRACM|nr:unnamed protein product [Brassica rapa]